MTKRTLNRRSRATLALLATGGVTATLVATSIGPASAEAARTSHPKPTVVLVHGAFADSTSWNGVIKELKRDGYPVVAAPTRCAA